MILFDFISNFQAIFQLTPIGAFTYYAHAEGEGGQRKCDYSCKGDRKMRDVRGGGPKSLKIV